MLPNICKRSLGNNTVYISKQKPIIMPGNGPAKIIILICRCEITDFCPVTYAPRRGNTKSFTLL